MIRVNHPFKCARHGIHLSGESPPWGNSRQPLVEVKGVHREAESEGRIRQNSGLRNTNYIRQEIRDKCA